MCLLVSLWWFVRGLVGFDRWSGLSVKYFVHAWIVDNREVKWLRCGPDVCSMLTACGKAELDE